MYIYIYIHICIFFSPLELGFGHFVDTLNGNSKALAPKPYGSFRR